ncbi:hypothetical protein U9M48_023619 [Paspalum notatum var. saurae]|uniref:Uncharacterized protein n=1 Tax=Paspalum notatum var. saurae TaxID=547442 RepID=A0AAQ3WVX5_PASNO
MARSMLKAKKMHTEFWGEAVSTAAFMRMFRCVGQAALEQAGGQEHTNGLPGLRSWEATSAEEGGCGWSSFNIDCAVYHGVGEAAGDGDADAGEAEQSGGGQAEQEAAAEPQTPPSPRAAQSTPPSAGTGGSVRFVTPPPGVENLDADYDNEPLRFRAVNDFIGDASPPGQAVRNLDGELFMASAEEPRSLGEAEVDARWRRAMERGDGVNLGECHLGACGSTGWLQAD